MNLIGLLSAVSVGVALGLVYLVGVPYVQALIRRHK
jgi:hypothetical protein